MEIPFALLLSNWLSLVHHTYVLGLVFFNSDVYVKRLLSHENYMNDSITSEHDDVYMMYSFVHFIVDSFLNGSLRNSSGYIIVVHHLFLLFLYYHSYFVNKELMCFVYFVHIAEFSSFFNVLSELIKIYLGEIGLYFYSKGIFVLSFIFLRFFLLSNAWIFYVNSSNEFHYTVVYGLYGFTGMHVYWYYLLYRKMSGMLSKKTD